MTEDLKPCREKFEEWMSDGDIDSPAIRRSATNPDSYNLMQAQSAWVAWQAAWSARDTDARIKELEEALGDILCMHDGNQSPAMNMPDLDYARKTIRSIHIRAKQALKEKNDD